MTTETTQQNTPRPWTPEEVAEKLIHQSLAMADYWAGLKDRTPNEMTRGVVFSMLAMLDGSNVCLPMFDLTPVSAEEDKEYHTSRGENYYVSEPIGLQLHELFHNIEKDFDAGTPPAIVTKF